MKQLEIEKMSVLTGGEFNGVNFVDGVCAGVGTYGVYALIFSITMPWAAAGAVAFCAGWAIGRGAGSVD